MVTKNRLMGARGRCRLPLLFIFLFELGISHNSTTTILRCRETERNSLMEFKSQLHDPWNRLSSWVGEDCCGAWEGISCNTTTGHVIRLDLRNKAKLGDEYCSDYMDSGCEQALHGDISSSLLSLRHLTHLDLSGNNFGHRIPTFLGSLARLTYLNLSNAGFLGQVPDQLGNLSTLYYLDLSNNNNYDAEHQYGSSDFGFLYLENAGWIFGLSSLLQLKMNRLKFTKSSGWLSILNALPRIQEVELAYCDLGGFPHSLPHINFTSLATLNLEGNFINSTAPKWLCNITTLEHLTLGGNFIYWSNPTCIDKLTSLKKLDLSQNVFSNNFLQRALSNLCDLQILHLTNVIANGLLSNLEVAFSGCLMFRLEELDLGRNRLNGSLPNWLGNFKNLKNLDLSENSLGSLPASLGNMKKLKNLNLDDNLLYGPLSGSLANMSSLQYLSLRNNYFNGTPSEAIGQLEGLVSLDLHGNSLSLSEVHLANLSSLKYLDISHNSLVLKETSNWTPPFQLQGLFMEFCQISPSDEFPQWLKTQKELQMLDISNAGIKALLPGWLPSSLEFVSLENNEISFDGVLPFFPNLIVLNLKNNSFSGQLPTRMDKIMPNVNGLDLSDNKIIGEVPQYFPSLQYLDLSSNLFSGQLPPAIVRTMPNLIRLDLSVNNLSGSIPSSFCQVMFDYLRVSYNNLSGEIPNCWKNSSKVFLLDFSHNQLEGGIPDTICNMGMLQGLHLSHNNLSGELLLQLKGCADLVTLDLGHNNFNGIIPTWLGESLPNLKTLNLRSNNFSGSIPQLYSLTYLQILDLSNNHLSGCIPHTFGNFSAMKHSTTNVYYFNSSINSDVDDYDDMELFYKENEFEVRASLSLIMSIDLSNNELTGVVPEELYNLHGLQSLDLSRNFLTGKIPENIGKMQQLEKLDLSRNNLSGEIPSSLVALNFLSYLNLSYNNLSGRIPTGNQLRTLTDPSIYAGNPNLCGPPLPNNCPENIVKENATEEDAASKTETIWLCTSSALGFIVGFWAICGTLLLKQRWRIIYFRAIDNKYDWLYMQAMVNMARIKREIIHKG